MRSFALTVVTTFILLVGVTITTSCADKLHGASDVPPTDFKPQPAPIECGASQSKKSLTAPRAFLSRPSNFDFKFQKTDGSQWIRHGRVENVDALNLLLVVDEPMAGDQLQTVVVRKSFGPDEQDALESSLEILRDPAQCESLSFLGQSPLFFTSGSIWTSTRSWDAAAEVDYNEWVRTSVGPNLLVGTGVEVDCADFAMSIRWIYAHDHGLPAGGTLEGSGKLFGSWQSTSAWDRLPTNSDWRKDERFKAALKYMLTNSQTHSIVNDLYPVAIGPQFVTSGTIYLTWHEDTGHTRTYLAVGHVDTCMSASACFVQIYGNLPKAETAYITTYEIPSRQDEGKGGLMRFRWPVVDGSGRWKLADPASMPGFSREQYLWDDLTFSYNLGDRLGLYNSHEELVADQGDKLASQIAARLYITQTGYYQCSLVPCAAGSPEDEEWSTPSRDSRMLDGIQRLHTILSTVDQTSTPIQNMIQSLSVRWYADIPIDVWSLVNRGDRPAWDPSPRADFAARWGFGPMSPEERARMLTQIMYNNWSGRENRVEYGIYECSTRHSKDCKPGTNQWKYADTTRLDKGFRAALKDFKKLYVSLPVNSRSSIDALLKSKTTGIGFCDGGCATPCTMYDIAIAHPEHIEKMTSDPRDKVQSRYGF